MLIWGVRKKETGGGEGSVGATTLKEKLSDL